MLGGTRGALALRPRGTGRSGRRTARSPVTVTTPAAAAALSRRIPLRLLTRASACRLRRRTAALLPGRPVPSTLAAPVVEALRPVEADRLEDHRPLAPSHVVVQIQMPHGRRLDLRCVISVSLVRGRQSRAGAGVGLDVVGRGADDVR